MGTNRLFWSQELLDSWILDEKITLEEDRLVLAEENRSYRVKQAVHFVADVGDGTDPHGLVGRVKEIDRLTELGAEHYMDSVLIEDCAYQVTQGFIGEPLAAQSRESQTTEATDLSGALAIQTGSNKDEIEADDRELLANFLLENL